MKNSLKSTLCNIIAGLGDIHLSWGWRHSYGPIAFYKRVSSHAAPLWISLVCLTLACDRHSKVNLASLQKINVFLLLLSWHETAERGAKWIWLSSRERSIGYFCVFCFFFCRSSCAIIPGSACAESVMSIFCVKKKWNTGNNIMQNH